MKQVNLKFIAFSGGGLGEEFSPKAAPLHVTLNIFVHVKDDVSIVPVIPRDRSFIIPCNGYYLGDETIEERKEQSRKIENIFNLYMNDNLLRISLTRNAMRAINYGEFWEICYVRQVECSVDTDKD